MVTTTKADITAANRGINAACKAAVHMLRNGHDHTTAAPLLLAAGITADVLLNPAPKRVA